MDLSGLSFYPGLEQGENNLPANERWQVFL